MFGGNGTTKMLSEPRSATAGMEDGMCQSIEEVDRISWEAEMMKAEEHFDAMDDDECEDCEEEAEGEAWSI